MYLIWILQPIPGFIKHGDGLFCNISTGEPLSVVVLGARRPEGGDNDSFFWDDDESSLPADSDLWFSLGLLNFDCVILTLQVGLIQARQCDVPFTSVVDTICQVDAQ